MANERSPGGQERPWARTDGVTALEYALLAVLIGVTIIIAVIALRDQVSGLYHEIATHVTTSTS